MKEHKDLGRNNQNKPLAKRQLFFYLEAFVSYWFCSDFRYKMSELDLSS